MGGPQNLRSFLQREVKKARIQPPGEPKPSEPETERSTKAPPTANGNTVILDTDSLFGDPIISQETKFEKRLRDFLSQSSTPHLHSPESSPYISTNAAIQDLKDELKNTIYYLENANTREKRLILRQKLALVEEIKRLEGVTCAKKRKESRAILQEQLKLLPEPMSRWERQRIISRNAKAEKAKQTEELKRLKKRERADDELEELDGEERHHLGVTKKQRTIKPTGHWKSDIHDYLPGFGDEKVLEEGGGIISLRQVSSQDRILLRRDLMELAKQFAQEDRKKHRKSLQSTKY